MELIVVSLAAFVAAMLTFFSGFGLGTLLTPVFVLFFPVDVAIASTGVVHFFNSLFKVVLVGRKADSGLLLRFGIPAVIAAIAGAWVLLHLTALPPLFSHTLFGSPVDVTPLKFIIGVLLMVFAVLDLFPLSAKRTWDQRYLPVGGFLSGFFGGLSGHQGALRSAFLIRAGLTKEAFIGTSAVIASLVDVTRLSVYASRFGTSASFENLPAVVSATLSALAGAYAGNLLLTKITLIFIQRLVAVMLVLIALALVTGLL